MTVTSLNKTRGGERKRGKSGGGHVRKSSGLVRNGGKEERSAARYGNGAVSYGGIRLFWPCSHFSGFMGNGQNLWHPVHFCLAAAPPLVTEPLAFHDCSSYFSNFPRPFPAFSLSLSLSAHLPLLVQYQRGFLQRILQIIFITGLMTAVLFLERISFFLSFPSSPPDYFLGLERVERSGNFEVERRMLGP